MNIPNLRARDLSVLRRTFGRFPWVREVRLFGSRVTGNARRASDIDLAISVPNATTDQWLELLEALEDAPIIYELDLVRMDPTVSPRLRERIHQDGITIYPETTLQTRLPPPNHCRVSGVTSTCHL
jgi:uncharacterized protein